MATGLTSQALNVEGVLNSLGQPGQQAYNASTGVSSLGIPMLKPSNIIEATMRKAALNLYQSSMVIDDFSKMATNTLSEEALKKNIKDNLSSQLRENILQNITFTRKNNLDEFNSVITARCFIFTKEQLEELIEFALRSGIK